MRNQKDINAPKTLDALFPHGLTDEPSIVGGAPNYK